MKRLWCCAIGTLIILLSGFNALGAANAPGFSLSGRDASVGKYTELLLSCENAPHLSAFVADISFDSSRLSYHSAKAVAAEGRLATGTIAEGSLRLVFFSREGIGARGKASLVKIKFKALKPGEVRVTLNLSQAVNTEAEEFPTEKVEVAFALIETAGPKGTAAEEAADTTAVLPTHTEEWSVKAAASLEEQEPLAPRGRDYVGYGVSALVGASAVMLLSLLVFKVFKRHSRK